MEVSKASIDSLLNEVEHTIQRHEADSKERGEDFNLFSIMKMESDETFTHSAIIAALLDPKGNHYRGSIFLEMFLANVGYSFENENLERTRVKTEYHIGKIDKEYEKGGFIDILLSFSSGKTIAIENKIYAKDQPRQLYRYSKHNSKNTAIFYLNLSGHLPHPHSYCTLNLEDIKIVSYRRNIIEWLDECLSICKEDSVLHASLKQYIILVKKLTNMMDKTEENDLRKAILKNLKAAGYVSSAYDNILYDLRENFRQAIIANLRKRLSPTKYIITPGSSPNVQYSQIWIQLIGASNIQIEFGVESFSAKGNDGGKLFVGIINRINSNYSDLEIEYPDKYYNKWWPVMRTLKTIEGNPIHLNSNALLIKLEDKKSDVFKDLVNHVSVQVGTFVLENTSLLRNIQKKGIGSNDLN